MAKIDVTAIAGYEEMSAEDKIKALESFEYDDGANTIKKLKDSVSNANSQAAEWKKKHNALLSEEEQAKQSRDEEFNAMKEKLEALEKEKTVAEYSAKFTALGYDSELATATAKAFADGDMNTVFANQKKFTDMYEQKIKASLLKDTPTPKIGESKKTVTKEDFSKMSYAEVVALKRENPELYNQLK